MGSNKRRRSPSSDDCALRTSSSPKYPAVRRSARNASAPPEQLPAMFISLPTLQLRPTMGTKRRSTLTPPSVTPPAVSITDCSTTLTERERCQSPPTMKARQLLAKVAVISSVPSAPSSPRMCSSKPTRSGFSSRHASPSSTPPTEYNHFPFNYMQKGLPESPDGGYVSFPVFEEFGGDRSDDEDELRSPPTRR